MAQIAEELKLQSCVDQDDTVNSWTNECLCQLDDKVERHHLIISPYASIQQPCIDIHQIKSCSKIKFANCNFNYNSGNCVHRLQCAQNFLHRYSLKMMTNDPGHCNECHRDAHNLRVASLIRDYKLSCHYIVVDTCNIDLEDISTAGLCMHCDYLSI